MSALAIPTALAREQLLFAVHRARTASDPAVVRRAWIVALRWRDLWLEARARDERLAAAGVGR